MCLSMYSHSGRCGWCGRGGIAKWSVLCGGIRGLLGAKHGGGVSKVAPLHSHIRNHFGSSVTVANCGYKLWEYKSTCMVAELGDWATGILGEDAY